MRILFLHPNFPAQFRHLAHYFGKNPNNEVLYLTKNERPEWVIPGVRKVLFNPSREPRPETHHYVRPFESAILYGQSVYRAAEQLRAEGFIPDVIYGHSGWGPTLFLKEVFPESPLICYYEWFYHARGSDADFDPADTLTADDLCRIRVKNASILQDLYTCDWGVCPTQWQKSQFPREYQSKLSVIFDGIDTDYFVPNPGIPLKFSGDGYPNNVPSLDLSGVDEIVTYVARGMETYRGFPQFMESIVYLQEKRPNCHVVIVGADRVCYGKSLPNGKSYKEAMLEKLTLDMSRVHFTGPLPYGLYRQVIQASSVHVYLTRPFVLSWSMMESLSAGCLILGSDTPPVREMIREGENGLLVDFFSPKDIAKRVGEVLDHPNRMAELRKNAREFIVENYALKNLLPKHVKIVEDIANRQFPTSGTDGFTPQMQNYMQNGSDRGVDRTVKGKKKKKKAKGFAL